MTSLPPGTHNLEQCMIGCGTVDFFPFFNGCVGAIDGTHVPMVVPSDKFIQHLSWLGGLDQCMT